MMLRPTLVTLFAVALAGIGASAYAQDAAPADAAPAVAAKPAAKPPANETPTARISRVAGERIGGKVSSVKPMPVGGLYEVVIEKDIFYVDAAVNYVIAGRMFDARTREDLTDKTKQELMRVDFKALPFDLAFKTVRGDGSRKMAVFADPNCPYCKKFEHDLTTLDNVTIYTFLFPILSQDSFEKSRAVWCAKDQSAAWNTLMVEAQPLEAPAADCKHPLQQILALGQELGVTGTPTIVFTDGKRLPGAAGNAMIERRMAEAAKTVLR